MPLPLTVSCFSKSRLVLPFWYHLTRVVPEKGPLNGWVCVCETMHCDMLYILRFSENWQVKSRHTSRHDLQNDVSHQCMRANTDSPEDPCRSDTSHTSAVSWAVSWAVSSAFGTLMADICSVLGSCFLMGWHHPPRARWLDLTLSVDRVTQLLSKEYKSLAVTETVQHTSFRAGNLGPHWVWVSVESADLDFDLELDLDPNLDVDSD